VSTVRLRFVSVFHANFQAPIALLSLLRFGWVSAAQRVGLHEPACPTGLSGPIRLERDHPIVRRSGPGAGGNRPASRGGPHNADPLRRREEELHREQARLEKSTERLVTAYQEGLVTLPQLRHRMPDLRKQAQAIESELQSLEMAAVDQAHYLQLAENLAGFCGKLRLRADTLDVRERQQILRLLVKEVLVDRDTITLRHSIPVPQSGTAGTPRPSSGGPSGTSPAPGYLLRKGSRFATAQQPRARRTRPGVRAPGTSLRSFCGL